LNENDEISSKLNLGWYFMLLPLKLQQMKVNQSL